MRKMNDLTASGSGPKHGSRFLCSRVWAFKRFNDERLRFAAPPSFNQDEFLAIHQTTASHSLNAIQTKCMPMFTSHTPEPIKSMESIAHCGVHGVCGALENVLRSGGGWQSLYYSALSGGRSKAHGDKVQRPLSPFYTLGVAREGGGGTPDRSLSSNLN